MPIPVVFQFSQVREEVAMEMTEKLEALETDHRAKMKAMEAKLEVRIKQRRCTY